MRIGFLSNELNPYSGGGYTFVNKIINEIFLYNTNKYEFCMFFYEKLGPKYIKKNNILYINKYIKYNVFIKIKRKILYLIKKIIYNDFDTLLKNENIELLCLLVPINIDVSVPYIFIVWDLGHRVLRYFPEVFNNNEWSYREELYNNMLFRAAYIVTGNETGKIEILDNYSVNPDKIRTIPFPVSEFCLDKNLVEKEIKNIKKPFIFYPAQFWAHKNHISIIEAIAILRDNNITIYCYFTGKDYGNLEYISEQIKKYKLENQIFILGFIETSELLFLYKNALAMVYLSLLGPNNLPPLEAAVLGCPLIYSNIKGHLEQMENIGIVVNATDPNEVSNAISSLYLNNELKDKIIIDEIQFSKKYIKYSYLEQLVKIFDDFIKYSKTWKKNK